MDRTLKNNAITARIGETYVKQSWRTGYAQKRNKNAIRYAANVWISSLEQGIDNTCVIPF